MTQKWYQKASVQTALVSGFFLLIGIYIPYYFKIPKLENELEQLKKENSNKIAEILRLETQLTPFKTIALEKFTGSEQEALKKLANQIEELQKSDSQKNDLIKNINDDLKETKKLSEPNKLIYISKHITKQNDGYRIVVQLKPSKPELSLGRLKFSACILGVDEKIINFNGAVTGMYLGSKISSDQKSAVTEFSTMGEDPAFEIIVSGPSNLTIYGNCNLKPIEIKKEDFL